MLLRNRQQWPRQKDNLAKVAVLLPCGFAFLTLNINPTTLNTILSNYSEGHWDPYDKWGISVFSYKGLKLGILTATWQFWKKNVSYDTQDNLILTYTWRHCISKWLRTSKHQNVTRCDHKDTQKPSEQNGITTILVKQAHYVVGLGNDTTSRKSSETTVKWQPRSLAILLLWMLSTVGISSLFSSIWGIVFWQRVYI